MSECMSAFGGMSTAELSVGLAQLKGEHPSLLKKIHGLQLLIKKIENETAKIFVDLKTGVANFKMELDPHSEREEKVLFLMLGKYIGTIAGPIAVMENEHEQAKYAIDAFLKVVDKGGLSLEEMKSAAKFVEEACKVLEDHFLKEESVLFPMAERMLSAEEKEKLSQRIQQIK